MEKEFGDILDYVEDEDFIVLDVTPKDSVESFTDKIFGDITKSSALKQVAIGGATGWVSGYVFNKVGKAAALTVASSLLVFQIARHNGYITVNWTKVQHAWTRARAKAKSSMLRHRDSVFGKTKTFYEENFFLATGFAGGFFFGFFV